MGLSLFSEDSTAEIQFGKTNVRHVAHHSTPAPNMRDGLASLCRVSGCLLVFTSRFLFVRTLSLRLLRGRAAFLF
jgi:hypothetical protein